MLVSQHCSLSNHMRTFNIILIMVEKSSYKKDLPM
nr:MAG TPA: hypothetical protein [Caudoviricetes sp.]